MIKKGFGSRIGALAVILIMLINSLSFFALAGGETLLKVSRDRFLTDEMYVSDGKADIDASGNVVIDLEGGTPSVTMNISGGIISASDNSLRVVLNNASLCEIMAIDYMYKNSEGVLETRSTECDIVKGNGAREYIIPIESPRTMTSLKLTFNGAVSGSISLVSIGTVSYYTDERSYCGQLAKSEYDPTAHKAFISGSVSWETVSKNTNAKIAIYRLKQGESAEDIDDPGSYIECRDISLNYNISLEGLRTIDSYARYFVAVLTKDGEILPIAPEFYLSFNSSSSSQVSADVGFKGIDTSLYGGAIEGGSSVAYVDVYLDRLFSYDENGFQYILDGSEYYVNKDYVLETDEKINAYKIDGVDIYLRLLVDFDGYGELFWVRDPSGRAKYYSVDIYDEKVFSQFIVYTEYLISRYSSENIGNIRGVVLGRSIDLAGLYNYTGYALSTKEYAEKIAKTSTALRNILDKYGKNKELILPFSNAGCAADQPIIYAIDGKIYPIHILASSILQYLRSFNVSVSGLYFMLEGDSSPIEEEHNDSNVSGGESERSAQRSSFYAPLLQCVEFEKMIKLFSTEHTELPDEFIYCWYPSNESPANNYIYNYNIAASIESIRSFVLSLAEAGENEHNAFYELRNAYKFADTDKNAEVSVEAIRKLGFDDWGDIIEGFSENNVIKRSFAQKELKNSIPNVIRGSYKMWDFEDLANASGWKSLYGCKDISIHTATQSTPRSLMFLITNEESGALGAEYGSAIYSQQNLLKVSGISGISFDVLVPKSSQEKIYEIIITVESALETVEFSGVVFCGSETTLYADIESIDTVKSIKLSARELSSSDDEGYAIHVKNISIHSDSYSDAELERMVLSGNLIDESGGADETLELLALFVVALIVFASIALVWVAWLIARPSKRS